MELLDWIKSNKLKVEWVDEDLFKIDDKLFYHFRPKMVVDDKGEERELVVDQNFEFLYSSAELEFIDDNNIEYVVFKFGSFFYYSDALEARLNLFKYIGSAEDSLGMEMPFLGIHGGYELCNGSRDYKDWVKKAKFLGCSTLGICEENTLAGSLAFQATCEKENIKHIQGETVTILDNSQRYNIKLYVLNEVGWKNLIRINNYINCNEINEVVQKYIPLEELLKYTSGLACILSPEIELNDSIVKSFSIFEQLFFQLDFLEWDSNDRDYSWLMNLKLYFEVYQEAIPSILISDAYYLDQEDSIVKKYLNKIGSVGFKPQSNNQFFKSTEDIYIQMSTLFKSDDERLFNIFLNSLENTRKLVSSINFKIKTGELFLPQYIMEEEESEKFSTNEELFYHLIEQGFQNKIAGRVENEDLYKERIEKEIAVIKKGGFIDYFLILADVNRWCEKQGFWIGLGRGSAAGACVAWLVGLTGLDPLKYGLIFERFLNEGRLKSGLPDVDGDYPVQFRNDVKNYIRTKYGFDSVTAIGTYNNLKLKAAVKGLNREFGIDPQKSNYISALLNDIQNEGDGRYVAKGELTGLFKLATQSPQLKEYIQQYPKIIELLPLLMNQPGTSSIHAAGIVITPKVDKEGTKKTIYDWMPVKKMAGLITSEWEGVYIDKMGFLKCDILGLEQLDKFMRMTKLIHQNHGVSLRYDDINLDEPGVFELFQNGNNEDVFQFTGYGLRKYCQDLRPENINDLIATNALYRPGPIDMGAHLDYIKIKNGLKEPQYDFMLEEITEPTYGLFVYQEQIMAAVQRIANFTLVEADDVRKAMGKIIPELLQSYGSKFVDGAIANGCPEDEARSIWEKLVKFGAYSYNKSHSACYAIMGYFSQWFKYKYPLEFWTTSLEFSLADELIQKIAEIETLGTVKVSPVDINKSQDSFYPDKNTNTIYWSLSSIKWVGASCVDSIIEQRQNGGNFFSLEEFYSRVEKRKVNKRHVENLIFSGAFDEIENIQNIRDRFNLLTQFYQISGNQKLLPDLDEYKKWPEYRWVIEQKALTGFGYINFKRVFETCEFKTQIGLYVPGDDLEDPKHLDKEKIVGGIIKNLVERKSKRGPFFQIELEDNFNTIFVTMWNESFVTFNAQLRENVGRVAFIKGKVVKDNYKGKNVIHTTENTVLTIL